MDNQEQLENTQSSEVQPPSVEESARKMGWRPFDEYSGDPEKWVDASIFVARAPLFEKIEEEKKARRRAESALRDFSNHYKNVATTEYTRALESLRAEKQSAMREGDTERALHISDQIDYLRSQPPVLPPDPVNTAQEASELMSSWVSENSWYTSDPELRAEADTIGIAIATRYQGKKSPEEILKMTSDKVKKMYPEKFDRGISVPSVEAPGRPVRGDSTRFRLTSEQERTIDRMIKAGAPITREQYIADLKKMGV